MRNIVITILAAFCISASQAGTFRIGLPGGNVTGVDFPVSNIAGAVSAASPGDTIQLYQQYWASTPPNVTVAKPLKFVGFGHTLDKPRGLQATAAADNYAVSFQFNSGSGGSVISGLFCSDISVQTSNITINRSKISGSIQLISNAALSNITISDNIFTCSYYCGSISQSGSSAISNMYVNNNVFLSGISLPNSVGILVNNVFTNYNGGSISLYSFLIRNNVFNNVYPAAQGNSFAYNIFSGSYAGNVSGTGNLFNVSMPNTFVNWNSGYIAVDTQLVLKPASPALGAGRNNTNTPTDCGIFGGEPGEEYVISGIPAIPAIFQLSAPSQTATGTNYNITIGIRSNK